MRSQFLLGMKNYRVNQRISHIDTHWTSLVDIVMKENDVSNFEAASMIREEKTKFLNQASSYGLELTFTCRSKAQHFMYHAGFAFEHCRTYVLAKLGKNTLELF
ncbi:MAG: hypothetical protein OXR66_06275 [Candidatus Woesearchaeota archaeon]|nr:hypothetical protein [Candidatus Woesearchaeota archaeon]